MLGEQVLIFSGQLISESSVMRDWHGLFKIRDLMYGNLKNGMENLLGFG